MKTFFKKWRGLPLAAALAASTLAAHATPQVKTLGGGPNQSGTSRSGSANGDTFSYAKFNNPFGLALDSNGNIYVADKANNKIRKITNPGASDSLTSTFVSRLAAPVGVAVDSSNNVYVVTYTDGKMRKFSNAGALLRNVSGLVSPTALALDSVGNVFVTELGGSVKRIATNNVVTIVTSGLNKPRGIAVLPSGLLAVSETGNNAVRTVDPTTGATQVIAGGNGAGYSDGSGIAAQFNQPYGIAAAPNGALVVADRLNNRVRVIAANNVVSTLYGVDKSQWSQSFPGWTDGPGGQSGTAAARDPIGLTVAGSGTVYVGEIYWDLIRQATETGLGAGNTTNNVPEGTNTVAVTGTNVISFGFSSGEGSSDFVAAPGQHFYAPVTLTVGAGQKIYSLQFALSVTNETGPQISPSAVDFSSMLEKPVPELGNTFTYIDPNYVFQNSSINLLAIGWITKYLRTNLYDTLSQDVITYSQAKDHQFLSADGKVLVGAYRVIIPTTATPADTLKIALTRPSATPQDWTQDVPLRAPLDGSLGAGAVNSVKQLSIGAGGVSRSYVVGDGVPFRWFNAGDFGEGLLLNNDVIQVFETAVAPYVNAPIEDSDLFDALDSSDGSAPFDGDDTSINSLALGNGWPLTVDDLYVTFRRSLDPTLTWYARYWSGGVRVAVPVPNVSKAAALPRKITKSIVAVPAADVVPPSVNVTVDDALIGAGTTLQIPIHVQVSGAYPLRVMMASVTVEALDGSPVVTEPIQFQTAPTFGAPELQKSSGPGHFAAAWLDNTINGISGDATLALLTVRIPGNAGSRAAYRIHFNHFSGSPNGVAVLPSHANNGLILLSDRSASTWGDGIADAWRLRHFGSIFAPESDPGVDADGDGVINSIEYQNGTNPTDATSN